MRMDKSLISGPQFMFTVALFLQSSALLTSFLSGVTLQDSWLVILFGIAVFLPVVWLYRTIMVMFPDKNFIQVLEEVYGKIAGKVVGVGYVWFFITLTALNLTDLGSFAQISVMPETPTYQLPLLAILVVIWAVRFGLRVVARYSSLFTVVEVVIVVSTIVLLLDQFHFSNFFPMLTMPAGKYVHGTHIITTIPFGELVVFMMLKPNVKMSHRETTKYWFWGVGMGFIVVLFVMARDIAILGNTMHMFTLPGLVSLRLVNLGEALSRMEILFSIALIMLLFAKVSILCYITTIALAQLMNATTYKHFALAVGILTLVYGLTLYSDPMQRTASAREIIPVVWTLFEILIPLITFIVAKIRKLPKAAGAEAGEKEAA